MNTIEENTLKSLRRALRCDSLEIKIGTADSNAPRIFLREQLSQFLKSQDCQSSDAIQSPQTRLPLWPQFDVSLSHCPQMLGFAFLRGESKVGFDIEVVDRVKEEIAARVSSANDLSAAPSAAALWVAKEAAFKALCKTHQARLLSEIHFSQWVPLVNGIHITTAQFKNVKITGATWRVNSCYYSVFKS